MKLVRLNWAWPALLGILVLASACNQAKDELVGVDTSPGDTTTNPTLADATPADAAPAASANPPVSTEQPTIKIANWEEAQQLVAQQTGKVVILDLWASW